MSIILDIVGMVLRSPQFEMHSGFNVFLIVVDALALPVKVCFFARLAVVGW